MIPCVLDQMIPCVRQLLEELLMEERVWDPEKVLERLRIKFGTRTTSEKAKRAGEEVCAKMKRAHLALDELYDALDEVAEYGWEWPQDGPIDSLCGPSVPYLGDDTSDAWVQMTLGCAAMTYCCESSFRTRAGLRGQDADHDSLDARTGLSERQRRQRERGIAQRRVERKRKQAKRQEEEAVKKRRMDELRHTLELCRAELSDLGGNI